MSEVFDEGLAGIWGECEEVVESGQADGMAERLWAGELGELSSIC